MKWWVLHLPRMLSDASDVVLIDPAQHCGITFPPMGTSFQFVGRAFFHCRIADNESATAM